LSLYYSLCLYRLTCISGTYHNSKPILGLRSVIGVECKTHSAVCSGECHDFDTVVGSEEIAVINRCLCNFIFCWLYACNDLVFQIILTILYEWVSHCAIYALLVRHWTWFRLTLAWYKDSLVACSDCFGKVGQTVGVLGIDTKLHPAVLPLLSPLGRSLSLEVQLGPIEVLIKMLMTRWWFGTNIEELPLQTPEAHWKSAAALSRYRQKCWWLGGCVGQCTVWCECRCICWKDPSQDADLVF